MVEKEEMEVMEEIINSMGISVEGEVEEEREDPEEILETIWLSEDTKLPANIEDEPTIKNTTYKEGSDVNDGCEATFGIDASTTKTIETLSGITFCIANARTGAINKVEEIDTSDIRRKSTIVICINDRNDVINRDEFNKRIYNLTDDYINAVSIFLPNEGWGTNYKGRIKDIARTKSEMEQLKHTIDSFEGDQGIVFMDGSIYPRTLVNEVVNSMRLMDNPQEAWEKIEGQILKEYIDVIDNDKLPIVGVVKNPSSKEILRTYSEIENIKPNVIGWSDDYTLMSQYLYTGDIKSVSYIPNWMESQCVKRKNSKISLWKNPDYKRQFFYCYSTNKNNILRIETARGFIEPLKEDTPLMDRIIAEISISEGVPKPVSIADSEARIKKNNSDKIESNAKDSLNSIVKRFNRDERNYEGDY
jgi:hypothetical protein